MKNIFKLLLVLGVVNVASADCYEQVAKRVERALAEQGHSFHGLQRKFGGEVIQLFDDANELGSAEKSQIGKLLRSGHFEFYALTATGRHSDGYQDLLVVSKESCATYRRFTYYVE